MYGHQDLHWKDSRLYLGSHATGNSITPDTKYPSMWRVRYPDGSLSDIVNLTRARDSARCRPPRGIRRLARPKYRAHLAEVRSLLQELRRLSSGAKT